MTIKEASLITGYSEQSLRLWIKNGNCPFGYVINKGRKRTTFLINENELIKWKGAENVRNFNRGEEFKGSR